MFYSILVLLASYLIIFSHLLHIHSIFLLYLFVNSFPVRLLVSDTVYMYILYEHAYMYLSCCLGMQPILKQYW